MGIDAIIAVLGLVVPPAVDFIKKKFLKMDEDTPERTLSTLATTKPEVMADYQNAVAAYIKAQVDFFNRDVSGQPSGWVIDLRAAIRPVGVVFAIAILAIMVVLAFTGYQYAETAKATVDGVRITCELIVTSWFGTRISVSSQS